jgi:hypothetical protein
MKEPFHFLCKNQVSPNGLFVLHCIKDKYIINDYIPHKHEQYKLEVTGHLVSNKGTYNLTQKGLDLLDQVDEIYNAGKKTVNKKAKSKFCDWEQNVQQYNELFPKGKKEGSSVSFRTNPKELCMRFDWFFKEFPEYTWEHVMEATKKYIAGFEMDYRYMQTSKYFIKKDDVNKNATSTLATMCYNIEQGNDTQVNDGYHYFGP